MKNWKEKKGKHYDDERYTEEGGINALFFIPKVRIKFWAAVFILLFHILTIYDQMNLIILMV